MKELPLNGFYSEESRKLSDRRCINFVPTVSDAGALSSLSLMPTAGIDGPVEISTTAGLVSAGLVTSQIFTFTTNQGKSAVFIKDGMLFSRGIYGINEQRDLPAINPSTSFARMATDGITLVIVCPYIAGINSRDRLFYYDKALNGVSVDTAPIFGYDKSALFDVAYLGGRFLYMVNLSLATGQNQVFYSELGVIEPDSLNFFAPDNLSSRLQGMEVINDRLYLFSEDRTYIYSVTQSVDTPFLESGELEHGLYGPSAKCRYRGAIAGVFKTIGGGYLVGVIDGANVKEISNRTINQIISDRISETVDLDGVLISMFPFTEVGRSYLCVQAPSLTLVFDVDSGFWHERCTEGRSKWQYIGATDSPDNTILVGDEFYSTESPDVFDVPIGFSRKNLGTENGGLVERTVVTSSFNNNNERIIVSEIQPQCEVDMSNTLDGWSNSKINLSVSNDFGNTFDQERSLNIGSAGEYTKETRFIGVGYYAQAITIKLRTISAYPVRIIRLLSRITGGYS